MTMNSLQEMYWVSSCYLKELLIDISFFSEKSNTRVSFKTGGILYNILNNTTQGTAQQFSLYGFTLRLKRLKLEFPCTVK